MPTPDFKTFAFCPWCGSRDIRTVRSESGDGCFQRKWQCPACGFDLYNNVASAVGLVIANDRSEILFERRAKEPRKGFLAFPGGFTDAGESGEQAAERECYEETGVRPVEVRYLCSFPNTYDYRGIRYKTCDLFFTASLPDGFTLKPQQGEVEGFVWVPIRTATDVDSCPLAFDSARKTLRVWLGAQGRGR